MSVLLVIRKSFTRHLNGHLAPHHFLLPNYAEPTNIHTYCPQLPNRLTLSLLRCQTISIFGKASPGVTGTGEAGCGFGYSVYPRSQEISS